MNGTFADPIELSLIIPAYNEAVIIERNVEELESWMASEMPSVRYEIVVVDDGSTDGMGAKLDSRASTDPRLKVAHHKTNMGRGRAIRTGFEASRGQYVICLDADLSYAPSHIPRLLEPLQQDRADITLASAHHPEGSVINVPRTRALMSRWGNRVLSTGVKGRFNTVTCIVRGYRREVLDQLELVNDGKDLHLEIIQKAMLFGLRVVEIPAVLEWRDRSRGKKPRARLLDRIPFLSMSPTIASHLVYNYVLRPGSFLNIPVIGLFLVAIGGFVILLVTWIYRIAVSSSPFDLATIYSALRETLTHGALTFLVMVAALVISMVFTAFYFASQQNKRNFEELYLLMSRMNSRIKQLEKQLER